MHPMHTALKKKILEMKGNYEHEEHPDGHEEDAAGNSMDGHEKIDADGKPEGSDLAPPRHSLDEAQDMEEGKEAAHEGEEIHHIEKMGELIKGAEGEQEALHDQHKGILASLADGGNMGQKGSGGGLRERVASAAKGKLAAMSKKY